MRGGGEGGECQHMGMWLAVVRSQALRTYACMWARKGVLWEVEVRVDTRIISFVHTSLLLLHPTQYPVVCYCHTGTLGYDVSLFDSGTTQGIH